MSWKAASFSARKMMFCRNSSGRLRKLAILVSLLALFLECSDGIFVRVCFGERNFVVVVR